MYDQEYIDRLVKRLNEETQNKLNTLFSIQKGPEWVVSVAETLGYMRAIARFGQIVADENKPVQEAIAAPQPDIGG